MGSTEQHLERWQAEGLLDAATAQRIRDFEAPRERERAGERPGIMEALIYLGLAVVSVGVIVLLTSNWDVLETWARITVMVVPAALATLVGQVMRTSDQPEIRRGGWVAWLVAVALFAGAAAVIGNESDWESKDQALAAGIVATALALAMWALEPQHPQVIGVAGSLFLLCVALAARADEANLAIGSGLISVIGLAGIILAELGLLTPRFTARAIAAAALAVASFYIGVDPDVSNAFEAVVFVAGAVLVVASIRFGVFVYMLFGVAAVFAGLIQVMLSHIDDPTLAALGLMVVGTLLIAGVLLLARFRPWQHERVAA